MRHDDRRAYYDGQSTESSNRLLSDIRRSCSSANSEDCAPAWCRPVQAGHPQNQATNLFRNRWEPYASEAEGPFARHELAMPRENRVRCYETRDLGKELTPKRPPLHSQSAMFLVRQFPSGRRAAPIARALDKLLAESYARRAWKSSSAFPQSTRCPISMAWRSRRSPSSTMASSTRMTLSRAITAWA